MRKTTCAKVYKKVTVLRKLFYLVQPKVTLFRLELPTQCFSNKQAECRLLLCRYLVPKWRAYCGLFSLKQVSENVDSYEVSQVERQKLVQQCAVIGR